MLLCEKFKIINWKLFVEITENVMLCSFDDLIIFILFFRVLYQIKERLAKNYRKRNIISKYVPIQSRQRKKFMVHLVSLKKYNLHTYLHIKIYI